MTRAPRGRSLLRQTFGLLVGSLIVVQLVITASIFLLSPPRQDGIPLGEIAERLDGQLPPSGSRPQSPSLEVHLVSDPGPLARGLMSDRNLTAALAARLHRPVNDVRLYYRPNESSSWFGKRRGHSDGVARWRGEPVFFDRAIAAVRQGPQWRTLRVPDRPIIAAWQKRMALLFGLSLLSLLPLAWLFARRLVRPIRGFADAADRVGRDSSAPMIKEDGPAEMRVAARALNAMQGRITEQLRERAAMVAAIAHDLRTPLSRIAFRIESADDALREPIQRDIDQMTAMISATLNFVRGSSRDGRQERIDLGELLDQIIGDEQHVARPVRWQHRAAQPCLVRGDPVALRRLVQNLIDNAITYGHEADISLRHAPDHAGHALVAIADRGPGLAPEEIEAMFAPFERKDRSRNRETGGVGLGLAIARAIARDHGGKVTLRPRDGGGLEARIDLPLDAGEP